LSISETTFSSTNAVAGRTVQYFNGLGQVRRSQSLAVLGTNEANNVWKIIDTVYDQFGRLKQASRPYRSGDSPQFTTYSYDVHGRKTGQVDTLGYGPSFTYNEASRPSGASSDLGDTSKMTDAGAVGVGHDLIRMDGWRKWWSPIRTGVPALLPNIFTELHP
jgi:hypothetical protein